MQVRLKEAEFNRKKVENLDAFENLSADDSNLVEREEDRWELVSTFDREYFYIEAKWEIIVEDDDEFEESDKLKQEILERSLSEHFALSHFTDFMGMGPVPLMPLSEETSEELNELRTSEEEGEE